jgi:hypothetical protein
MSDRHLRLVTDGELSEATKRRELIARGKAIAESGKYTPRGAFLGRLQSWGLDVYEGSPQEWKNALFAEWDGNDAV